MTRLACSPTPRDGWASTSGLLHTKHHGSATVLATIAFDFDSTLVRCETLEVLVAPQLEGNQEKAEEYRRITEAGMSGGWTFAESLQARLAVAAPSRPDLDAFTARLDAWWTPGMPELVRTLVGEGEEVWIVSGAPAEVIVAAGAALGVPAHQTRGVRLIWEADGGYRGIDPEDPFSRSKVEGLTGLTDVWARPRIMVGDGLTDRAVFDEGLVDHFIPFTGHVRRDVVVGGGIAEAVSAAEVMHLIHSYAS